MGDNKLTTELVVPEREVSAGDDEKPTEEGKAAWQKVKSRSRILTNKKAAQEAAAKQSELLLKRNANYVAQYLERRTQFSEEQVRALQKIYQAFTKGSMREKGKSLDRLRFRELVSSIFDITDNVMLDCIFTAFDADNAGSISEAEWIIGLSTQLRGTLQQQTTYAYDVYDFNRDGGLGREEVRSSLRGCFFPIPGVLDVDEVDEAVNDLVETAMRKFDLNQDGQIHYSEFRHVVKQDPTLLEAFGPCLPTPEAALTFTSTFDSNPRNFKCHLSRPGDPAWNLDRKRYKADRSKHSFQSHNYSADPLSLTVSEGSINSSSSPINIGLRASLSTNMSIIGGKGSSKKALSSERNKKPKPKPKSTETTKKRFAKRTC